MDADLMKMLTDKLGGDPSKINSIFTMMQASNAASNHAADNSSTTSETSDTAANPDMPDIETIMKIKKVMDSMKASSNDPSVNLLSSLKPYLRDEKKSKVDQYIKMLSMGKAISSLNDLGGDPK
ncbi:MAG: hypothetical protein IJ217_00965 [Clostridia bacterium]|nr:hypothetical protein [Clostridia bacterium]